MEKILRDFLDVGMAKNFFWPQMHQYLEILEKIFKPQKCTKIKKTKIKRFYGKKF